MYGDQRREGKPRKTSYRIQSKILEERNEGVQGMDADVQRIQPSEMRGGDESRRRHLEVQEKEREEWQ
jgi:DNA-binding PadR family transcriptional regulator